MYRENILKYQSTPDALYDIPLEVNKNNTGNRALLNLFSKLKSFVGGTVIGQQVAPPTLERLTTHPASYVIQLEISLEKMNELLAHKTICAADVRCLDPNSKHCLMKLCLQNCLTGCSADTTADSFSGN